MAEKSKYVIALDQIQSKVYEFLKPLGFRKKGRTFNREANEKGIFQVVSFHAGPYTSSVYGKFNVGLGVLIKELYDLVEWHEPTNFYQSGYCQASQSLSFLLYGKGVWWDLSGDPEELAKTVIDGFKSAGLFYFAVYDTRAKFRESYGRFGDAPPRAKLDIALMVRHTDRDEGDRLFREYYAGEFINPDHRGYVEELAARLGIPLNEG